MGKWKVEGRMWVEDSGLWILTTFYLLLSTLEALGSLPPWLLESY
jgi:hypothetical protein